MFSLKTQIWPGCCFDEFTRQGMAHKFQHSSHQQWRGRFLGTLGISWTKLEQRPMHLKKHSCHCESSHYPSQPLRNLHQLVNLKRACWTLCSMGMDFIWAIAHRHPVSKAPSLGKNQEERSNLVHHWTRWRVDQRMHCLNFQWTHSAKIWFQWHQDIQNMMVITFWCHSDQAW